MDCFKALFIFCLIFVVNIKYTAGHLMPYPCRNGSREIVYLENSEANGVLEFNSYSVFESSCNIRLVTVYASGLVFGISELSIGSGQLTIDDGFRKTNLTGSHVYNEVKFVFASTLSAPVIVNFTSPINHVQQRFKLYYTAFTTDCSTYYSNFFKCDNGRCIANDLKCDGLNHCGDMSDNNDCNISPGIIVGYTFIILLIAVIVVCICIRFAKRKRSRTTATVSTVHPPPLLPPQNHLRPPRYMENPVQLPSQQGPTHFIYPDAPPPYNVSENDYGRVNPLYQ